MSRSRAGVVIFNYRDYNNVQRKIEGAIAIFPFLNVSLVFIVSLFLSAVHVFSLSQYLIDFHGLFTCQVRRGDTVTNFPCQISNPLASQFSARGCLSMHTKNGFVKWKETTCLRDMSLKT